MTEKTPFASHSLAEHLLRGAVGAGALAAALYLAASAPLASLALGVVTLIALRGCPVCWSLGLAETIARAVAKRRAARLATPAD